MNQTDAELHRRTADKAVKTSKWMCWQKPDFDLAAREYDLAAKSFYAENLYIKSVEAHKSAAESRKKIGDNFGAGRSFEKSASVCEKFLVDLPYAIELYDKAVKSYVSAKISESAFRVCCKIGTLHGSRNEMEDAMAAFESASNIPDMSLFNKVSAYKQLVNLQLKSGDLARAEATYTHMAELHRELNQGASMGKSVVAIVIIHLSRNESQKAEGIVFEFYGNNSDSAERKIALELIEAFQLGDKKRFFNTLYDPWSQFLSPTILNLAKKMAISQ